MEKYQKEILITRLTSVGFFVLALGVFQALGFNAHIWESYLHLLAIWVLGVGVCYVTEGLVRFVFSMPPSLDKGVNFIIRRNLVFQIINTPLEAMMVCGYRHFILGHRDPSFLFSWGNFFQCLAIFAFCSFAIGMYWRFKYRSRFLAAELEETRLLNERLIKARTEKKQDSGASGKITLTGSTSESVSFRISDFLYAESIGNYVKVYFLPSDRVDSSTLRATMNQVEDALKDYSGVVRCHRAFLVNLRQVDRLVSKSGVIQLVIKNCPEPIPVSRSHASAVKESINTI